MQLELDTGNTSVMPDRSDPEISVKRLGYLPAARLVDPNDSTLPRGRTVEALPGQATSPSLSAQVGGPYRPVVTHSVASTTAVVHTTALARPGRALH